MWLVWEMNHFSSWFVRLVFLFEHLCLFHDSFEIHWAASRSDSVNKQIHYPLTDDVSYECQWFLTPISRTSRMSMSMPTSLRTFSLTILFMWLEWKIMFWLVNSFLNWNENKIVLKEISFYLKSKNSEVSPSGATHFRTRANIEYDIYLTNRKKETKLKMYANVNQQFRYNRNHLILNLYGQIQSLVDECQNIGGLFDFLGRWLASPMSSFAVHTQQQWILLIIVILILVVEFSGEFQRMQWTDAIIVISGKN